MFSLMLDTRGAQTLRAMHDAIVAYTEVNTACHCYLLQIPVAEGAHKTFAGIRKEWVPDFVHGDDGFGNMNFPEVKVSSQILQAHDRSSNH